MKFDFELVGKVGSMALIDKKRNALSYDTVARISQDLRPGDIWVTSGAVEVGRLDYIKRNGFEIAGDEEDVKTDYSAQGQTVLMNTYRQFIDPKYSVRQILVEHQHFNDPEKREHLRAMLLRAREQGAIPIINYNDAVSCEETRNLEIRDLQLKSAHVVQCVDNDETASQIACLMKAKTLLIMSSTDGIYTDSKDKSTLVSLIGGKDIDELIKNVEYHQTLCEGASRKGAGGAKAKLEYIKEPLRNGTTVIIGSSQFSIRELLEGSVPRTVIKTY